MSLLDTFKNIIMSEPKKTLLKFGVINSDESLSSEGKELFINWLFQENQEAFVKGVVEVMKKEEEKESKKK